MKKIFFSKLEGRIMNVFWHSDESLSISGIQTFTPDLSVYSVRQVVHKLEKLGFVKVSGYTENQYSPMRVYAPIITQFEYCNDLVSEKTRGLLIEDFIQHTDDLELLKKYNNLIQKRLEEKE